MIIIAVQMPSYTKILPIALLFLIFLSECFALACSGARDFESQYNELKAMQAKLESSSPASITSLQEIKKGIVMQVSDSSLERLAESAPIAIKLETSAQGKGKIYYALATSERYYSTEEYGGFSLFNWFDASGTTIVDGVKTNFIAQECSGWSEQSNALAIDLSNYTASERITLFTVLAVPKETYFVLLCAPTDTTITIYYLDGTQQSYNLGKGINNGGEQIMLPIGFYSKNSAYSFAADGKFIEQTIEKIKEQKACVEERAGKKHVKWNLSGMLEEVLGTYVPPEREPDATEENRAPILQSVYFQPPSPTAQDDLKCVAEANDPDNDPLTYIFIWKLNGKKFDEITTNRRSTTLRASEYQKQPGQIFECSVTVSDGTTQAGPISARVTIAAEHPIEQGGGELSDSDNDGVPDESDECPNEAGPASNKGCPVEAQEQQPESPLIPNKNQILFIFMPIDWQGTEQAFSSEVSAQLAFLREKSGIASAAECSNLKFVKKELPKSLARECGISVRSCINIDDFLIKVFNCLQQKTGITLNNRRIIFAGLTDINPGTSIGKQGFIVRTPSGQCASNIAGFHLLPNPRHPQAHNYVNTQITMALASNVGSPRAGFQPLSHEIGHCIGFCEQYSLQERIKQDAYYSALGFGGCTNKYPGAYQVQGNKLTPLFGYPYDKCPTEALETACPEFVAIRKTDAISLGMTAVIEASDTSYAIVRYADLIKKSGQTSQCIGGVCPRTRTTTLQIPITGLPTKDCLGRRFIEKGKATRDMMGPGSHTQKAVSEAFPSAGYSANPARSFDCFEKEQFKRQWCSS